jgi:hypothetical protein
MKGMLFTALLELIEAEFGSDVLDSVLDDVKPAVAVFIPLWVLTTILSLSLCWCR